MRRRREALFSSLDEEVAAEALEEVEPKTQKTLMEALDSETIAGILEEMDPGAAADLLSELSDERSHAILEEMDDEERREVEDLLEFRAGFGCGDDDHRVCCGGRRVKVSDAMQALGAFEGDLESVTELFVVNAKGHLVAIIPLSRLMLATGDKALGEIQDGHMSSVGMGANGRKVAELFDKYNLRSLPVLNDEKELAGVIRPEHVIGWLRSGR